MKTPTTFEGLVSAITDLVGLAVPVIFGVLFIFILWKLIDAWVINAGDEKKQSEGKQLLIIAVVVIVIMVSLWGIVSIMRSALFY